ncbi:tetratricopeptide repeat protein [Holophaga foetida]|uniref:tetratricopeptide repeat protein n=1 Tax=Holophaga foetida TaxID=35839 RepID=UPI00024749ED|nr:tetratricopeptide repeat protein [Holophaga foetida]
MRTCAFALFCCALGAQSAPPPDASFFKGDPKVIMVHAADKARVRAPRNSQYLARWAQVYLASGDRSRAEDAFQRALREGADDPGTHALITLAWLQNGFKKEALAAYKAMPKDSTSCAEWLARMAQRFLEADLEPEALQAMETAHRLAPGDWQACVEFGRSAVMTKRLDLAGDWFLKAVQTRPRDEEVWTQIALAYGSAPR